MNVIYVLNADYNDEQCIAFVNELHELRVWARLWFEFGIAQNNSYTRRSMWMRMTSKHFHLLMQAEFTIFMVWKFEGNKFVLTFRQTTRVYRIQYAAVLNVKCEQ